MEAFNQPAKRADRVLAPGEVLRAWGHRTNHANEPAKLAIDRGAANAVASFAGSVVLMRGFPRLAKPRPGLTFFRLRCSLVERLFLQPP